MCTLQLKSINGEDVFIDKNEINKIIKALNVDIENIASVKIKPAMEVKIKKLNPDAVIPTYAKPGDAGMDLTAVSVHYDEYHNVVYGTGLAFEIPEGYVGLIFPRSSNRKTDMYLTNSVGVIDSGYRGEVMVSFKHRDHEVNAKSLPEYHTGERVAQIIIMPYPPIEFVEVDELSKTEREDGGFGSTGK